MRWISICALIWLRSAPTLAAQSPQEWAAATRQIRRLPPDSFPQLPRPIRSALRERGCSVPQSFTSDRPHNVVKGSFARAEQLDWAVLCSREGSSSVLIFWGEKANAPTEFDSVQDAGFLQGIGSGRIGYSRLITAASPAQIREYVSGFGGALPKRLDHDGLEDAFAEKASGVAYLEDGRWLMLTGAD